MKVTSVTVLGRKNRKQEKQLPITVEKLEIKVTSVTAVEDLEIKDFHYLGV